MKKSDSEATTIVILLSVFIGGIVLIAFIATFFLGSVSGTVVDNLCAVESSLITTKYLSDVKLFCFDRNEDIYPSDFSKCPYVKSVYDEFKETDEYDEWKDGKKLELDFLKLINEGRIILASEEDYYYVWTDLDATFQSFCAAEQMGALANRCWKMHAQGADVRDMVCFNSMLFGEKGEWIIIGILGQTSGTPGLKDIFSRIVYNKDISYADIFENIPLRIQGSSVCYSPFTPRTDIYSNGFLLDIIYGDKLNSYNVDSEGVAICGYPGEDSKYIPSNGQLYEDVDSVFHYRNHEEVGNIPEIYFWDNIILPAISEWRTEEIDFKVGRNYDIEGKQYLINDFCISCKEDKITVIDKETDTSKLVGESWTEINSRLKMRVLLLDRKIYNGKIEVSYPIVE